MNRNELYQTFVDYFQEGQSVKASDVDIRSFEQSQGISLPESYRTFIKSRGTMKTHSISEYTFNEEDGMKAHDLLELIPFLEVAECAHQPTPRGMPEDLLPYANDSMGNLFCFKRSLLMAPSDDSSVWFFDHEYCKANKIFDGFDSWLMDYVKLKT